MKEGDEGREGTVLHFKKTMVSFNDHDNMVISFILQLMKL